MSRARRIAFWAVVAAQALFPLTMVALNETALASGNDVRLQAVPVDPHDPFRGEYVALAYEISNLPAPPGAQVGDTVYVVLEPKGGAWGGSVASLDYPVGDVRFIRGHITELYDGRARIEYGIETYYVEEGRGPELEDAISRSALYVDVVLDDDGGARIDEVVIEDA